MERVGNVLRFDYLDVHNIRHTMKTGERPLLQYFKTQEFLHGLFLMQLEDIELPEEHSDLRGIIWNTLQGLNK